MECHEVSLLRLIGVCKASVNLPSRFTAGGRVGAVSIPVNYLRMVCELFGLIWMRIILGAV